jgi:hypothetical protein
MSSTLHQSGSNPLRRALTGATLGVIVAGGLIVVGLLSALVAVIVGLSSASGHTLAKRRGRISGR